MIFEVKERFNLSDNFIEQYKGKQPEWGPLGYVTYKRSYAREIGNRTEEFWETCKRVVEGVFTIQLNHCRQLRLPWNAYKAQHSAQEMYRRMFAFKWLPPGRGLFSMGSDVIYLRGSMSLYNCAFCSTKDINYDFTEPFCWMMDISMCGVGVAFDTRGAGKIKFTQANKSNEVCVVEDSKEGWVEAIRKVLAAYTSKTSLCSFDYSQIRPSGAPLVTSGGIAPGPQPLIDCVEQLTKFLETRIGNLITSTDIVDLMNIIGKCVVAGGKRRTAQLAHGEPDDALYVELKDPKYKEELLGWRWASNNSIYGYEGLDYTKFAEQIATNGEPGIVYLDKIQHYGRLKDPFGDHDINALGVNPCAEISLEPWEVCNIVETFPSRHEDEEDYLKTLKYAYMYVKTVTLLPTHMEKTNQVQLKNRRVGVSMSGIVEAIERFGTHKFFTDFADSGYAELKKLDKIYSDWLCVPRSNKLTTVKPSGTVSLLPGVTPGVHYAHSEYYYRTIRLAVNSSLIEPLRKAGYRIEESVYGDNTMVVYFPVYEKDMGFFKSDVSIWQQLELGSKMQYYWADNSVSQTVTFNVEEAKQLKIALEFYEDQLKTVSFLPLTDHSYAQAPYQTITKEEYEEAIKNLKPIKFKTNTHELEEKFCDGEACTL